MSRVYFVACRDMIKIGRSRSVEQRLLELQVGNPYPLRLLGTVVGGRAEENRLHELLSDFWHRGEWFRRGPWLEPVLAGENCSRVIETASSFAKTKEQKVAEDRLQRIAQLKSAHCGLQALSIEMETAGYGLESDTLRSAARIVSFYLMAASEEAEEPLPAKGKKGKSR